MRSLLLRAVEILVISAIVLSLATKLGDARLPADLALPTGDPFQSWQTLETEHFTIIAPETLASLTQEVARLAERAWQFWADVLELSPPWGKATLVLTDQGDARRVSVRLLPHPMIVIEHPQGWASLAWGAPWRLEEALYQAYGKLLLETAVKGITGDLHGVLGALIAPGRWQPFWLKEGVPAALPSLVRGDLEAEDALANTIVLAKALADRLPTLAQLSIPVDREIDPLGWLEARAVSALFVRYLVEMYGLEAVVQISRAYAEDPLGALTGRTSQAAAGRSLGELYHEFTVWAKGKAERTLSEIGAQDDDNKVYLAPLSMLGGLSDGLAWSPFADELVYRHRDRWRMAGLRRLRLSDDLQVENDQALMTCECGPPAWLDEETLIYPKLTRQGVLYRIYDVYTYDLKTQKEQRLTYGERVYAVAPFPDGQKVLWVRDDGGGHSSLIVYDLVRKSRQILLEFDFSQRVHSLAISPEGKRIALALWTRGEGLDLYLLSVEDGKLQRLTRSLAYEINPAFSPDGGYVLFSSDLENEGLFEIYALRLSDGSLYRVTRSLGGGLSPGVSPDGRSIAFVSYDPKGGFGVYALRYDPESWEPISASPPRREEQASRDKNSLDSSAQTVPYDPAPALLPTFWLPLAGPTHVGLRTGSADPLGWHRYTLTVGTSFEPFEAFYELAYTNARLLSPILTMNVRFGPLYQRQEISLTVPFSRKLSAERELSLILAHENGISELGMRARLFDQEGLNLLKRRSMLKLSGSLRWVATQPAVVAHRFELEWEERLQLPWTGLWALGLQELSLQVQADWSDRVDFEGEARQHIALQVANRFAPLWAQGKSELLWDCCASVPGVLALSHPQVTLSAGADVAGASLDPQNLRIYIELAMQLRLTLGYGLLAEVLQVGGRYTLGEPGPQLYVSLRSF